MGTKQKSKTMKTIEVTFEVTMTFTKHIQFPSDMEDSEIQKSLTELGELWNWGDLDDEFNEFGPPEFDIDFYDIDKETEANVEIDLKYNPKTKRFQ